MNRALIAKCFHEFPPWPLPAALSLAVFLLALCAWRAGAADATAAFESANRLYEEGKFLDAATAYEKLVQSGAVSPALYFNLGNAFFKSGRIGRAIAAYRQAADMTPRDPDVRANLQFARNQVQGPTLRAGRWERALGELSLNEWTLLAAGALWLMFVLLVAVQLRPQSARSLRSATIGSAGAAFVLCGCLGLVLAGRVSAKTAIVVTHDVTVRNGPLDESQSAFTAQDGAELRVLDEKDDWLQVSDDARRIGWLRRDKALLAPAS